MSGERADEWRRGWPAVAACAIGIGTGPGLFQNLSSLFLPGLEEDFGWSIDIALIDPTRAMCWHCSRHARQMLAEHPESQHEFQMSPDEHMFYSMFLYSSSR